MTLEVTDIMEILPHRYPMLLIDRIIELEPMKYAIGIKNATFNEQFFPRPLSGQAGYAGRPHCRSYGPGRRYCPLVS